MRNLSRERIENYYESLLNSRKKLTIQLKKDKLQKADPKYLPLNSDIITMQDVKLYNYLHEA